MAKQFENGVLQIIDHNMNSYQMKNIIDYIDSNPLVAKVFWAAGRAGIDYRDVHLVPIGFASDATGPKTQQFGVVVSDFDLKKVTEFKLHMTGEGGTE